ncbi:MAG: PIG-L family deacetylase [Acidobacteria bacterium]|nr:PIG-L family deacetylase [Acidobacteriota bacterium]
MTAHELSGRSLMTFFAHPDDESLAAGGLIASCAAAGSTVTLVVATRGEAGPGREGAKLAAVRTREMEAAARVLGASELVWLDYPDGLLPSADAGQLEGDIARTVAARRPEQLVTFDRDGLYWHPDHVALHERVTAAIEELGDDAPGLWYVTMPHGAMRAVADHAAARGRSRAPILGVDDPDAFGAEAPAATITLDVRRHAARKLAALACHATQFHGSALAAIAPAEAVPLLGREQYRCAHAVRSQACT